MKSGVSEPLKFVDQGRALRRAQAADRDVVVWEWFVWRLVWWFSAGSSNSEDGDEHHIGQGRADGHAIVDSIS